MATSHDTDGPDTGEQGTEGHGTGHDRALPVAPRVVSRSAATVSRELLSGPLGRVSANDLRRVLQTMATAMDLEMLEPWEP